MLTYAGVAAGLVVVLLAAVYAFQRRLIYLPYREAALPPGIVEDPPGPVAAISMRSDDGLTLSGWHFAPEGGPALGEGPVCLYFPGNAGNRRYRVPEAALLVAAGAHVLLFDYRGFGDNPGSPEEDALARDARCAWRFAVAERGVPAERIVLYGESLGGGVATRLAADLCAAGTPPAGLLLRSTFSTLADAGAKAYPFLPVRLLLREEYDSLGRAPAVTCPVLVVHGARDSVVPVGLARRLFAAFPARSASGREKRFVELPEADHNDVVEESGPGLLATVRTFLHTLAAR